MFLPIEHYLFDKANSSIIHGNYPIEDQRDTRLASITFMKKLGSALGLPSLTICSASYFFHYFFMFYSMKKYSYIDVAITCILVATKSEETYRKIKQILISACFLLNPSFKGIGSHSEEFEQHKVLVATYERLLLDVIKFNFSCYHPHEYAFKFSNTLTPNITRDQQIALWSLLDLVYYSEFCLRFPLVYSALYSLFLAVICNYRQDQELKAPDLIRLYRDEVVSSKSIWKQEFEKWESTTDFFIQFIIYVEEMRKLVQPL